MNRKVISIELNTHGEYDDSGYCIVPPRDLTSAEIAVAFKEAREILREAIQAKVGDVEITFRDFGPGKPDDPLHQHAGVTGEWEDADTGEIKESRQESL